MGYMRINVYLVSFLLFAYCGYSQNSVREASAQLNTAINKKTDSLAKAFLARSNSVGIAIGIMSDGNFYSYGYGETKKGNNKTPDGRTLFEIGSITKTFTGILLAYFVEQKKLSLDDPVNKYLPDSIPAITFNGKPVTLASLSNHTSGLPRLPGNFWDGADMQNPYKHYDNQRLFQFLKNFQPVREPGAQYEYSNLAVGLLAVILERVSGKTYEQLLREIIWQPLKMNNTRIVLGKSDSALFATGHNAQADPNHSWEFISLAGAGAIRSSVNDLLNYARAQFCGGSGSLALCKAITLSHQQTWARNQTRVGLGWHLISREGSSYIFHNGQTGGYYSVLLINPETSNAVVMLTNGLVDPMGTAQELMTWLDKL
jgi:CubicO group peptidase (beta-lactamase class C family)